MALQKSPPSSAGRAIALGSGFRRILSNIGWLVADRFVEMSVSLVVGVLLARHLGAEGYGLFNYAISFVALFGFMSHLGLESIVIREIVLDPSAKREILGSAFALQLIGGCVGTASAVLVIRFLRPDDLLAQGLVVIIGLGIAVRALSMIMYWFKSQVKAKYNVMAKNIALLPAMAANVVLVLVGASVGAFAWVRLGQTLILSVALVVAYWTCEGSVLRWLPRLKCALLLLKNCWPLAVSALAVTTYMKIDQVMLGEMAGDKAVGIYSAAVRLSGAWYFLPVAVAGSVFPAILRTRERDSRLYYKRLQHFYDAMTWCAIAAAAGTTVLAQWMIDILYGAEYKAAGPILMLHIWSAVFVFQGVAASQWLLAEKLQVYHLVFSGAACVVNIALNYLLIPVYGPRGAAIGTIISYGLAVIVAPFLFSRTRKRTIMLVRSYVWPLRAALGWFSFWLGRKGSQ